MTGAMPALVSTPDEFLEILLSNRKLTTKKEIDLFFNPKLEDFEKELKLPQIAKAKKRIEEALSNQEQIIVFGDYDVDGLTATAIIYHALTARGGKVLPYIPHREKEGYGLSKIGLDYAKEQGAKLVITVDNGIVAINQAEYAKKIGLDLIITDHHVALDEKPEAVAMVHSTSLCGAGVAWCLARELVDESLALELLIYVAMGTICDMMPLVGVNRYLVKEGLRELVNTHRAGLLSLMTECGLSASEISAYHISHILGPRLNAAGRMESAMDALRLLCTKDPVKARKLAQSLCVINDQKKMVTTEAIDQSREIISKEYPDLESKKILILSSKEWIPGIIGLMAGRIAEEYKIPAIVISEGELQSKGSARSSNGVDIVKVIRQCSDLLIDVGGHPKAAGFTLETKNINKFKKLLEEIIETIKVDENHESLIEAWVNTRKLSKKWLEVIERLEPYGVGNPKPVLGAEGVMLSDLRTVGQGKHLKFKGDNIEAIAFSLGNMKSLLKEGQIATLTFQLDLDTFNGADRLQLKVQEIDANSFNDSV